MPDTLLNIEPYTVTAGHVEVIDLDGAEVPDDTSNVEIISDLDALSDGNACSCTAGDDNPF